MVIINHNPGGGGIIHQKKHHSGNTSKDVCRTFPTPSGVTWGEHVGDIREEGRSGKTGLNPEPNLPFLGQFFP